jgi:hypothetical protein
VKGTTGLTAFIRRIVRASGPNPLALLWRTRRLQYGIVRSRARRRRVLRTEGLKIPVAIAISPTMRCNLACEGCYSRFHPREDEIPFERFESFVSEAVDTGVMLVLVHLPYDEYDGGGRCMAVDEGAFHVTARGYVEPVPFAHFARKNIRTASFRDVLRSPFLGAIRAHPTVLQLGDIGCALANNRDTLEEIARRSGASVICDGYDRHMKGAG